MKKNPHYCLLIDKKIVLLFTFFCWFALYVLNISTHSFNIQSFEIFNNENTYSLLRHSQNTFTYLLGNIVIFLIPGLLFTFSFQKKNLGFGKCVISSCVISLITLIFCTTLFKLALSKSLNGHNFIMMLGIITSIKIIILIFKRKTMETILRIDAINIILGILFLAGATLFLWTQQSSLVWGNSNFDYSHNYVLSIPLGLQNDLLENFGLVNSLNKHLLPYWDLEYANKFGTAIIDPPLRVFIISFLSLFFTQSLAVQTLNTLIVISISFWFCWKFIKFETEINTLDSMALILPFFCCVYLLNLSAHYEILTIFTDHVHLLTLFTLLQFYCLITKQYNLFLLFATLAFLTKYEAMLFTVLGLFFYHRTFDMDKSLMGSLLKKYTLCIIPYILLILMIAIITGNLGIYTESFLVERFTRIDHFQILPFLYPSTTNVWDHYSLESTYKFLKQFLFGSSFMGIFIFFNYKDRTNKYLSKVAIVYLLLILISRGQRMHYISPLVLLSCIIAARTIVMILVTKLQRLKNNV